MCLYYIDTYVSRHIFPIKRVQDVFMISQGKRIGKYRNKYMGSGYREIRAWLYNEVWGIGLKGIRLYFSVVIFNDMVGGNSLVVCKCQYIS